MLLWVVHGVSRVVGLWPSEWFFVKAAGGYTVTVVHNTTGKKTPTLNPNPNRGWGGGGRKG